MPATTRSTVKSTPVSAPKMSARSHIMFREPTEDDYQTFASEFWDVWEEGESRANWCSNAAQVFVARFPAAHEATAYHIFEKYWDMNILNDAKKAWKSKGIRLYHREVEAWWDAFCDEIRDEGVRDSTEICQQAYQRFKEHFHRVLWTSSTWGPLSNDAEDKTLLTEKLLTLCERRYHRCTVW